MTRRTREKEIVADSLKIENSARFGDAENNLSIDDAGTLTLNGNATVWDDLRVPLSTVQTGGILDPDFAQFKDDGAGSEGVFAYLFDKTLEEEVFFSVQMPHTWREGTNLKPHVHWCPVDTDTGAVVWGLEYTWSNIGAVFGNTTIITVTKAAGGTAYYHYLTAFDPIDATGKTASSMLVCRAFRKSADENDTYDNDAALLEVDFHYEIDKLGEDVEPGT